MRAVRTGGHIEVSKENKNRLSECHIEVAENVMAEIRRNCRGCGFDSYKKGIRGNEFLRLGKATLLKVKNIYTLIDSEVIPGEWIADTLIDINKSVCLKWDNSGKESYIVNLPNVQHRNRKGKKCCKYSAVNIVVLLSDLQSNKLTKADIKNKKIIDIVDREVHHNEWCYNNILGRAVVFSREEHKKYHEEHTKKSKHRVESFYTIEGLLEFMNKFK